MLLAVIAMISFERIASYYDCAMTAGIAITNT